MPLPDEAPPTTVTEKIAATPQKVADALDKSPRIVNDWRMGFRWLSSKCFLLVGAAQSTWMMLDADQRASLPHNFIFWFTGIVSAVGFLGRFYKQRDRRGFDDDGRKCDDGSS
jgi:hypothetical protein